MLPPAHEFEPFSFTKEFMRVKKVLDNLINEELSVLGDAILERGGTIDASRVPYRSDSLDIVELDCRLPIWGLVRNRTFLVRRTVRACAITYDNDRSVFLLLRWWNPSVLDMLQGKPSGRDKP